MAAAAITRTSNDTSNSTLKMSSPKDPKVLPGKSDDVSRDKSNEDSKPTVNGNNGQPLAPPPKPSQNSTDTPDYFNSSHNSNTFSLEPNPFEQSFGNPSTETPGGSKSILPPVASITSPSPLPGVTPGWNNSLRSGPLSPAMLAGPANPGDYFSGEFRSFPTPNESSLRTGLTPGGGGSMFPAPSPNSQHLFQLHTGGGATPSTLDFHRTALSAAQASNQNKFGLNGVTTSAEQNGQTQTSLPNTSQAPTSQAQQPRDMFAHQDVHGAANDLLQFASQANGNRNNQFAVPNQPNQMNPGMHNQQGQQPVDGSPTTRRATKGSIGTNMSGSMHTDEQSESGHSEQAKPSTRTRGKKGGNSKASNGNRRASDEPAGKGPAKKKSKSNNGMPKEEDFDDDSDEDGGEVKTEHPDGRKMTDEEKRKNFLERNRVAALKCRQRKKQWLANLQAKVELFSTENDALSAQVTQLREEVVNLKTLLLAHKDCPVSQAQGLNGMNMASFIGDLHPGNQQNPYGIGMHGMMQMNQGPGQMQRG